MRTENLARNLFIAACVFIFFQGTAQATMIMFEATLTHVEFDNGTGTYAGALVGDSFSGDFAYGTPDQASEIGDGDPGEIDWEWTGAPFGGSLTDGLTAVGGAFSSVQIGDNFPSEPVFSFIIDNVGGDPVPDGTPIDWWLASALTEDEESPENIEFAIGFLSLDTSYTSGRDFLPLPPGTVGGADFFPFFYIQETNALGITEFLAVGTLDSFNQVLLPTVDPGGAPDGGPIFSFDFEVEAGELVFIDPVIAIGYDYEIGEGDPLFATVTLPDVGDGIFDLWLFDGGGTAFDSTFDLLAGVEFDFTTLGVLGGFDYTLGAEKFRILGIEIFAGLDPEDASAFITALTFMDDGQFTGTMTPITVDVAEPGTLALFAFGLLGLGAMRRRRKAA